MTGPDDATAYGDLLLLPSTFLDRLEIRELLENWVIWRDAGDWDRFATLWHTEGRMMASWTQANAADFIEGCRKSFDADVTSLHSLGGTSIDVNGFRAVAQSKMQIRLRAELDGVAVDSTCIGRFVDALEKLDGRWLLVLRQPVYELDWIVPVEPGLALKLDANLLRSFPAGYQHIAYLQTKMGFTVNREMPGIRGPEIEALRSRMQRWLAGDPRTCLEA